MTVDTSAATLHVWLKLPGQPVKYLKAAASLLAASVSGVTYPLLANLCSKPPETMTLVDQGLVFARQWFDDDQAGGLKPPGTKGNKTGGGGEQ